MRTLRGCGLYNIEVPGDLNAPHYNDNELRMKNHVPSRINQETNEREMHLPKASYIGPKTDIVKRLRERVKPTTRTDRGAMKHDVSYYNIRNRIRSGVYTHKDARSKIRESDNLLLQEARKNISNITNPLNAFHGVSTSAGMKAKELAEDNGIIDKLKFVGEGKRKKKKRKIDPVAKLSRKMQECARIS